MAILGDVFVISMGTRAPLLSIVLFTVVYLLFGSYNHQKTVRLLTIGIGTILFLFILSLKNSTKILKISVKTIRKHRNVLRIVKQEALRLLVLQKGEGNTSLFLFVFHYYIIIIIIINYLVKSQK